MKIEQHQIGIIIGEHRYRAVRVGCDRDIFLTGCFQKSSQKPDIDFFVVDDEDLCLMNQFWSHGLGMNAVGERDPLIISNLIAAIWIAL